MYVMGLSLSILIMLCLFDYSGAFWNVWMASPSLCWMTNPSGERMASPGMKMASLLMCRMASPYGLRMASPCCTGSLFGNDECTGQPMAGM